MNRRQLLLVLEEQPRDVVREIVLHCTIHDEHVRDADDGDRRGDSGVGARWNLDREIEIAIRLTERRDQIAARHESHRDPRRVRQILDRRGGQAAAEEEGVIVQLENR